jgi:hypothetical protein
MGALMASGQTPRLSQPKPLCDTCRQHWAPYHFEEEGVQRHLCIECHARYPMSDWQQVEQTKEILLQGKCEVCGGQPFAVSGIPGPQRKVLCSDCLRERFG